MNNVELAAVCDLRRDNAEYLANNRAILVRFNGSYYFPTHAEEYQAKEFASPDAPAGGGMGSGGFDQDPNIVVSNVEAATDGTRVTAMVAVQAAASAGLRRIVLETDRGPVMAPEPSPPPFRRQCLTPGKPAGSPKPCNRIPRGR